MPADSTRVSFKQQAIAFAVATAFQPCVLAQTLPSGGQVVAGQASISQPTPSSLQIHQGSDKAILNWQSFSIGAGAQVNFQQPSTSSVALNRVLGNNPSQIFGQLSANGRVFLVNPSGVLFGPGASVSVGGLVASTLSITDDDFMAGRYVFSNSGGAGSVVNQGSIFSHSGYTALLGPQVTNEGFIFANVGSVALAAGDRVTLDMVGDNLIRVSVDQAAVDAAVVNRGSIEAFGGNVLLSAHSVNALLDTVLNTDGVVRASAMTEQDGEIVLHGGPRGTMVLGGEIFAAGAMSIAGEAVVIAGSGGRDALVGASRGQTVNARSLAIRAADGNNATLSSFGAAQTLNITGGSLEVQAADGGFVDIASHGGDQTIAVRNGDHFDVNASGGGRIFMNAPQGTQTHSITGSGRNAMTYAAEGTGSIFVAGSTQHLIAGNGAESGSMTVSGPDADRVSTQISVFPSLPGSGEQTISTSGALTVVAGSRAEGLPFLTGFVHSGQGAQTISAASMELRGGAGGSGNPASIISVGGGEQRVDVTGDLVLLGGPGGSANLFSNGPQAIRAGNLLLRGAPSGSNNGAFINTNPGVGQRIEVSGGQIVVAAGDGGVNNGAGIISRGDQVILGRPDLTVSGAAGGNASIQGLGALQTIEADNIYLTNAASSPVNSAGVILGSHQRIDATGDVTLVARSGTGTASGVRIGAAGSGATDLVLTLGGNLLLQGGTTGTNGAGLGGAGIGDTSDNNIVVNAAGDVILDGAVGGAGARIGGSARTALPGGDISITGRSIQFIGSAPAAIRTAGNVELQAGEISQGPNGFILANALRTGSDGSTSLTGANQVSSFSGSSATGDISLRNSSPLLTLGMVNAPGALSIDQGGSILIRGGDASDAPTIVRGGLVNVATGGDLRLVGGNGDNSHAHLLSGGNVDLTVGGTLRLEEGSGKFSWARVQTESKDAVINLAFPNLSSGGFYVNGVEGDTKDGKTGFFVFHAPARIGDTLILEYQE